MTVTLDRTEVKAFYDRFGSKQDAQGFYEDRALADLIAHSDFVHAKHVFEFGCGTGRLAEKLLEHHLAHDAIYEGVDISSTMISLARQRLARFGERARVRQIDGTDPFAGASAGIDRIVTTYVLDLMPDDEVSRVVDRSAAILQQEGILSIASLTMGNTLLSRAVSAGWRLLFRVAPRVVGGCRPIRISPFLAGPAWRIERDATISSFGIASEIVVAVRRDKREV